eukprot:293834-Rhodomonas_salina.2
MEAGEYLAGVVEACELHRLGAAKHASVPIRAERMPTKGGMLPGAKLSTTTFGSLKLTLLSAIIAPTQWV